ncbi:cytochrome ubiquinol oxidase subunit I [Thermostichus vulcanus]|uniref:Cytochrome ubiquinol oxidase subunit I n=1 Tax=Thermostichus vulcanus str. 'Rupite' TaxID=2813851 RepID=A0ABT0C7B8_THEVL|nr:cytochrome ubiquinol oxidase subunit I [Thermostichus vulcanus]MCJ2541689.1 cytochrome ubiquinol oxidase subunit I [Thermostichus vulcanus str. 'Rupite']
MAHFLDTVVLSRIQFALTSSFHMLWPVLTTGMGIYLVLVEGVWLRTRNISYYHHARFWTQLYLLNFGIGVASGLPMEFQFGTNWAPFSEAVGDFFGSILGFEGSMAFMLEAGFLGIMVFGWNRVPGVIHYLSTIMVAFGANLSTFWILTANSWMQTPVGGELVNGKFVVKDYFAAIFNPAMLNSVAHMFLATLETSLFVVGGISAWYVLNRRHPEFFGKSLKIALAVAIVVAPLQIAVGHESALHLRENQPTKLAAMEAQWETLPAGEPAAYTLLALPDSEHEINPWSLEVPYGLGLILDLQPNLQKPVLGLKDFAPENRPPLIPLIYYSFRVMVGIGFFLAALMLVSTVQWLRGKLADDQITGQTWLMRAWLFAAPLGYIAVEAGWIVREVGRQPWTVYGLIRTSDAASHVPATDVLGSLSLFTAIYGILFVSALHFGRRILLHGPNLELPPPGLGSQSARTEMVPDRRPTEVSA